MGEDFQRPQRGGAAAFDAELLEDVGQVALDGFLGGTTDDSDVAVGFALGDPEEDFRLAWGEAELLFERRGGIEVGREAPGLGDPFRQQG